LTENVREDRFKILDDLTGGWTYKEMNRTAENRLEWRAARHLINSSECVSSDLMAHQYILFYSVPYNGVKCGRCEC